MIALINDGDADRSPAKILRGGESAESSSNDDDMMRAWHRIALQLGQHILRQGILNRLGHLRGKPKHLYLKRKVAFLDV